MTPEGRFSRLITALASDKPAPASGSAAAAVVAVSAALLQKVALRSREWVGAAAAHERAETLRLRAEELIELDAIAYLDFVDAIRSGGDVERARQKTIDAPADIARLAQEVVELAHELEERGHRNLKADATAAAILASAAATTAMMLVDVNVKGKGG